MKHEISIEFFPPQTPEGMEKLRATWVSLAELKPAFFSVTYGTGGSTRERTFSVVKEIVAGGFAAAPHLSCIGSTRDSIREILNEYKAAGIRRTVALRGDDLAGQADSGEEGAEAGDDVEVGRPVAFTHHRQQRAADEGDGKHEDEEIHGLSCPSVFPCGGYPGCRTGRGSGRKTHRG